MLGLYPSTVVPAVVGGSSVPWRFTSTEVEYRALREAAGIIDLSSLGLIRLTGSQAETLLQGELTKDIAFMMPERSVTGLLLSDNGMPLDLVLVYKIEGGYLVETSAGRGSSTVTEFEELVKAKDLPVTVEDLSSAMTVIGVEGPDAWRCAKAALELEMSGVPYEGVTHSLWRNSDLMISRTGFTSEFGFKVIAPVETAPELWQVLTEHGVAVGFEALEITMVEVRQPRLHREVEAGASVMECGLNWLVDIDKEDFTGREAILSELDSGPSSAIVGVAIQADAPVQTASALFAGHRQIGQVVDAVHDPGLGETLALARIEIAFAASGLQLEVECQDGSIVTARTLSSPYRVPTSWYALRSG